MIAESESKLFQNDSNSGVKVDEFQNDSGVVVSEFWLVELLLWSQWRNLEIMKTESFVNSGVEVLKFRRVKF